MSCVYTYDFKQFKTKKALNEYIEGQKEVVKSMYLDYHRQSVKSGAQPTLEGFKEYYGEFDGLPKFQAAPEKLFTVQGKNLKAIQEGRKTLSFRTVKDGRNYKEGDIMRIALSNRDTSTRVIVKKVHNIAVFPDIEKDRKDNMARMLGDYKDYADMMDVNDYLNPNAWASRQFGEYRNFLLGKEEGVFIEYSLVTRTAEEIIADAKGRNPANDRYKYVFDKVVIDLAKQIQTLERAHLKNESFKANRLDRLNNALEKAIATEDLLTIIEDTLEDFQVNEASFNKFIEDLDTKPDDLALNQLFSYWRFVKSYSFLDEIAKKRVEVLEGSKDKSIEPDQVMQDVEKAITIKNRMENTYLKKVEPLIAKKLKGSVAKNALKQAERELVEVTKISNEMKQKVLTDSTMSESRKKKIIKKADAQIERLETVIARAAFDEDSIANLMNFVEKDIDFAEFWMGAAAQSSDPIIAMFSLATKENIEEGRKETIKIANELQTVYDEFIVGKKSISLEKIYGGLVEVHKKGKEDRMAFVSKYDKARYSKDKKKFIDNIDYKKERAKIKKEIADLDKNKTPTRQEAAKKGYLLELIATNNNSRIKSAKEYEFYKENTKQISEDDIRAILKENLKKFGGSQEMLIEWAKDHMSAGALKHWGLIDDAEFRRLKDFRGISYKGDFVTLSDKYLNKKWEAMYNEDGTPKNTSGKLHKKLVDTYLKLQEKLPERDRQGLILPGIYKGTKDRVIEGQGVKKTFDNSRKEFKERFLGDSIAEDTEYGSKDSFGNIVKNIPVYYTNNLAPEDTSIDLMESILKYTSMATTYEARNKSLEIGMFLLDKMERRTIGNQNSFGHNIFDRSAKSLLGIKKQSEKPASERLSPKRLEKFVEMVVYGESSKEARAGNFRVDKAVAALMQYASFTAFALPVDAMSKIFMQASANFFQQIAQQTIEVAGDPTLSMKTLLKGQELFIKHSEDILLKDFGKAGNKSFMGQLIDQYDVIQGEFLNTAGQKVSGSTARKLMSTDTLFFHRHLSEYEPQVAMFLGVMNEIKVKQGDKEISLIDAYELVNGEIRLKKDVEWSASDEARLRNRLHGINKYMNGVYNSFDKSVLEQQWWGKALMFFRKYLYPSLRRRWSSDRIDYEMDEYQRGFAVSFWRALNRDLFVYKKNFLKVAKGDTFTTREKQDAAKTLTSFGIWMSFVALSAILTNIVDADDDDESLVYNYLLYNSVRMKSELSAFWNPMEMLRILKSPTILTTYIERITRFTNQLMFDPFAEYERKSGANEKGDSKLNARFWKMVLGQTQYSSNPDKAVANFKNLIN